MVNRGDEATSPGPTTGEARTVTISVALTVNLLVASMLVGCAASDDGAAASGALSSSPAAPSAPSSGLAFALPSASASAANAASTSAVPSPGLPPRATATGVANPSSRLSVASSTARSAAPRAAGFHSSITVIDAAAADRMRSSWRPGCPVALEVLRYVTVTYRGFDNADHTGELVVAASVTDDVVAIFHELYLAALPIASLRLVDDFDGSDAASMAADNSSAFNCRTVTGGSGFSEHSYGTALDLNPVQNPSVSGDVVLPEQGRIYVDRSPGQGVILADDATVRTFARHGWSWGGDWRDPVDYQHFSVTGG